LEILSAPKCSHITDRVWGTYCTYVCTVLIICENVFIARFQCYLLFYLMFFVYEVFYYDMILFQLNIEISVLFEYICFVGSHLFVYLFTYFLSVRMTAISSFSFSVGLFYCIHLLFFFIILSIFLIYFPILFHY
jgi:hypothetical protein